MANFERGFAVDELVTMLPKAPLKMCAHKATNFAIFWANALFAKNSNLDLSDSFCDGYGAISGTAKKRVFALSEPFVRVHPAQQTRKLHKIKEIYAIDASRKSNLAGKSSDMNEIRACWRVSCTLVGVEVIQYERDTDEFCCFGKVA